jgi:hypothetical protein
MSHVLWGEEKKNKIKGWIQTCDVSEINAGYAKDEKRLYIVSADRTLEIEAKTVEEAKEFKIAFEILIQSQLAEQEKAAVIADSPAFKTLYSVCRKEHRELLCNGDVFKKWPAKSSLRKGSFTCRRLWCSPTVKKLSWGAISTSKEKGFILLSEVVYVMEDATDKLKFTVHAKGRSLDIEAKSIWIREKWIRALRFFIAYPYEQ